MEVTHKIKMALDRQGVTPVIDAVQGEDNVRVVEIALTCNHKPWQVPENVRIMVRFRKPDGTGGIYDTLEDGSAAITVAGNMITVILAGQMMTAPGRVAAQVELNEGNQTLSTFEFGIRVQPDPSIGAMDSKDYYNLSSYVRSEVEKLVGDGQPGTNEFVVNFEWDTNSYGYKADKSFEEIDLKRREGKKVCGVVRGSVSDIWLPDVFTQTEPEYISFGGQYCRMNDELPEIYHMTMIMHQDGSVSRHEDELLTRDYAEPLYVSITQEDSGDIVKYSANRSFAEIMDAQIAGRQTYATLSWISAKPTATAVQLLGVSDYVMFHLMVRNTTYEIRITRNDDVYVYIINIATGSNGSALPAVSEEDDGKILTVVGGKWVAAELPVYDGVYAVTPSATEDQILATAQTFVDANIIISKIPYTEVENNSGGITVNIGG